MSLSKEEIDGLLRLIGLTRDEEIDCERCLALVAEFAERELAGRSVPAGLEAVAHHLSICCGMLRGVRGAPPGVEGHGRVKQT